MSHRPYPIRVFFGHTANTEIHTLSLPDALPLSLDGTTNFLHGFPQFAVSIALKYKNRLEVAVVYDPIKNDLFTAARGEGAKLNDRKIRVTPQKGMKGALLGTGFPFKQPEHLDTYLATFKAVHPDVADRKSTRLNSSHRCISYAVFCLTKKII